MLTKNIWFKISPPSRSQTSSPIRPAPNAPYHPPADTSTYRDLLLFEERLKSNAEMLRRRRRRYSSESFLSIVSGEDAKLMCDYISLLVELSPDIGWYGTHVILASPRGMSSSFHGTILDL